MSVYFIVCDGAVKIGFTGNFQSRMYAYRAQFKVIEELGVIPGDMRRERSMHERFSHRRKKGEWFYDSAAIRAEIKAIIDAEPPPPAPPPEPYGPFLTVVTRPLIEKQIRERFLAPVTDRLDSHHQLHQRISQLPACLQELVEQGFARASLDYLRLVGADGPNASMARGLVVQKLDRLSLLTSNLIACDDEERRRKELCD